MAQDSMTSISVQSLNKKNSSAQEKFLEYFQVNNVVLTHCHGQCIQPRVYNTQKNDHLWTDIKDPVVHDVRVWWITETQKNKYALY